MIRVVHPGSGSWFFTHPGSQIQGSKKYRILDPGSGSATPVLFTYLSCWPRFPRWVAGIFPPWPAAGALWPARRPAAPLQQLHSHPHSCCCCCCYSLRRSLHKGFSPAVLRIHDVLVRIRILDPSIFVIDLQDANKKQIKKVCSLLFESTLTSFFEDKK